MRTISVLQRSKEALRAGGNEFVGYRLDTARNFQINFLVDEDGQIAGLTVPNDAGPIKAKKLNNLSR